MEKLRTLVRLQNYCFTAVFVTIASLLGTPYY